MRKFLNIEMEGEDNIGVIDLGEGTVKYDVPETETANKIKRAIESKIITALESHFDCTAKIRLTNIVSVTPPICAKVFVVIESDDEDSEEVVMLNETWVY